MNGDEIPERSIQLLDIFLKVFSAAEKRDRKELSSSLLYFNSWYRKASVLEQGIYHQLVADFMKGDIR